MFTVSAFLRPYKLPTVLFTTSQTRERIVPWRRLPEAPGLTLNLTITLLCGLLFSTFQVAKLAYGAFPLGARSVCPLRLSKECSVGTFQEQLGSCVTFRIWAIVTFTTISLGESNSRSRCPTTRFFLQVPSPSSLQISKDRPPSMKTTQYKCKPP